MVVCSPPQPMWGHHNPPPSGASVLAGTLSFLQSMWDHPQIHPLWGPVSLLAHRLVFMETTRRLAHRPVSNSGTICNSSDIVLFGLSLSGFPSTHFHALINSGLFSSPTNVGHHKKNERDILNANLSFFFFFILIIYYHLFIIILNN